MPMEHEALKEDALWDVLYPYMREEGIFSTAEGEVAPFPTGSSLRGRFRTPCAYNGRATPQPDRIQSRSRRTKAFERRDYRFFGILGIGLLTSGAAPKENEEIKVISWTTDNLENDLHPELNKLAEKYAESYNRKLSELLEQTKNE